MVADTVTHPVKRFALFGGFIPLVNGGKRIMSPVYVRPNCRYDISYLFRLAMLRAPFGS